MAPEVVVGLMVWAGVVAVVDVPDSAPIRPGVWARCHGEPGEFLNCYFAPVYAPAVLPWADEPARVRAFGLVGITTGATGAWAVIHPTAESQHCGEASAPPVIFLNHIRTRLRTYWYTPATRPPGTV